MKLLKSITGFSLSSGYSIVMPSNYIPWGGPGSVENQQELFRSGQIKVKGIAQFALKGEARQVDLGPLWQNITFSWIYKMSFPKVPKMDKKFWVDDKCNRCEICFKVCPAENLAMKDGKPSWLQRCEQCLACIQWCPQKAIQYGKKKPSITSVTTTPKSLYKKCSIKPVILKDKRGVFHPRLSAINLP